MTERLQHIENMEAIQGDAKKILLKSNPIQSRYPRLRGSAAPPIHGSADEPVPFIAILRAANSRPQVRPQVRLQYEMEVSEVYILLILFVYYCRLDTYPFLHFHCV